MFKNSGNKICLQQFLKKEFRLLARQCPTVRFVYSLRSNCWDLSAENEDAQIKEFQCHHIEADTILLYIYSQLRKNVINDDVVIDAEDTDVIVLAAYVTHQINGNLGIKKKWTYLIASHYVRKKLLKSLYLFTFTPEQTQRRGAMDTERNQFSKVL